MLCKSKIILCWFNILDFFRPLNPDPKQCHNLPKNCVNKYTAGTNDNTHVKINQPPPGRTTMRVWMIDFVDMTDWFTQVFMIKIPFHFPRILIYYQFAYRIRIPKKGCRSRKNHIPDDDKNDQNQLLIEKTLIETLKILI